jgi:hypothetical protein
MTLTSKAPKIELILQHRQVLSLREAEQQMAIECKSGVLWVTHSGEIQDYVLEAGKRYIPSTKGSIVIQALGEACLGIEEN